MLKSPSNAGSSNGASHELKYQKAIKEITKLVSLNTSLKKEVNSLQGSLSLLRAQHDQLQQRYNCLLHAGKKTETEKLPCDCQYQNQSWISHIGWRKENDPTQIAKKQPQSQQIAPLHEQKIAKHLIEIEKLNAQIQARTARHEELQRKYSCMSEQLAIVRSKLEKKRQAENETEDKKIWISLENLQELIKQTRMQFQPFKNSRSWSLECKTDDTRVSGLLSSNYNEPTNCGLYFEQILRMLESAVIKVKSDWASKKSILRSQIAKLRQENQVKVQKLMKLLQLVQKQQSYIQKLMRVPDANSFDFAEMVSTQQVA